MIRLLWDISNQGICSSKTEGFMRRFIILLKALALTTVFTILAKFCQRNIYSVTAVIACSAEKVWQTSAG